MNDYSYDEIKVGQEFEFKRIITGEDINDFAKLTGDFNPLHCDEEYTKNTQFKRRIAQGMLAGSLFSTLVGMVCPGKRNLYLSQSLNFKKPLYPGSELLVKGEVKDKTDSIRMVRIKTEIICEGSVVITGEAKVKVVEDQNGK